MGWSRRQDDWRYKQEAYRRERVDQQIKEARQKATMPLTPQKKLLIFFGLFAFVGLEIGYNAGHQSEGAAFVGAVVGLAIAGGIILLAERAGAAAAVKPHPGRTPFAPNQVAPKSLKEKRGTQRTAKAKPIAPSPSPPRGNRKSKQVPKRANHLHINAMEKELGIAPTVWDVEPGPMVSDARTTDTPSPREEPASTQAEAEPQEVSSSAPAKTAKRRDDIDSNVWVTVLTDGQLDKLRVHYEMKGETGNHAIVCTEIARRTTAAQRSNAATRRSSSMRREAPSTETKMVKTKDLTDQELANVRAVYELRKDPKEEFNLLLVKREQARRAKNAWEAINDRQNVAPPASTPPPSSAGKMTIDEAIAQAKAEGFDYEKRVAQGYEESMKQSPLELRMEKKLWDRTIQSLLGKGDYDGAVMVSARFKGIQQALDEKAASRSRETA